MRGGVTDAGRTTNEWTLKIELLSHWKLEAEFRNLSFHLGNRLLDIVAPKNQSMYMQQTKSFFISSSSWYYTYNTWIVPHFHQPFIVARWIRFWWIGANNNGLLRHKILLIVSFVIEHLWPLLLPSSVFKTLVLHHTRFTTWTVGLIDDCCYRCNHSTSRDIDCQL